MTRPQTLAELLRGRPATSEPVVGGALTLAGEHIGVIMQKPGDPGTWIALHGPEFEKDEREFGTALDALLAVYAEHEEAERMGQKLAIIKARYPGGMTTEQFMSAIAELTEEEE